jgi:NADPH-dependent 2,4-dienoyl-CoA reductase/sulfur reductase-like enzyme
MLDPAGAPVLIIGASAAGLAAAQTLRDQAYRGAITIIDRDPNMPYERPPLSKSGFALLALPEPSLEPEEIEALSLDLLTGLEVETIDPADLSVRCSDGQVLKGQAVLLATGAAPVMPNMADDSVRGICALRSFNDRQSIGACLKGGGDVAVIGGGLIGAETVAACLADGHKVHWIDMAALPMNHVLPPPIARFLVDALLSDGATLHTNRKLSGFRTVGDRLQSIMLDDGSEIAANVAIVGIGAKPEVPAGLECSSHLLVDTRQRTDFQGVFAAGDAVIRIDVDGHKVRCGHWQAAQWQGANAALAMLGKPEPKVQPNWFWSDQGIRHVEMIGSISAEGSRFVRTAADCITSFEFETGRLVGVASVNDQANVRAARRLLGGTLPFPAAMLIDPVNDPVKLLKGVGQ